MSLSRVMIRDVFDGASLIAFTRSVSFLTSLSGVPNAKGEAVLNEDTRQEEANNIINIREIKDKPLRLRRSHGANLPNFTHKWISFTKIHQMFYTLLNITSLPPIYKHS
jgi:hypothetical protein